MTIQGSRNASTGQMKNSKHNNRKQSRKFISEKKLAELWDCHRTTVSRILSKRGVRPYYLGPEKKGLKRYALSDIEIFVDESKAPNTGEG
jgi:hypothetical protein